METIKLKRERGVFRQNISFDRTYGIILPTDYTEKYVLEASDPFRIDDLKIKVFYVDTGVILEEVKNLLKTVSNSDRPIRNNKFPVETSSGFGGPLYREKSIITDQYKNNGLVRFTNKTIIDLEGKITASGTATGFYLIISGIIEFQY